jgi:hypothetical protein
MVKTWQETFPDQRDLVHDFDMSILYKKNHDKPYKSQYENPGAEIDNVSTKNKWPELKEAIQYLPEGYELAAPTKGNKTIGLEFKKSEHDTIAIKKAKLDADYSSQQVDYVSWRKDGKYIARNGDGLYKENGKIYRIDTKTEEKTLISDEEISRLGINEPYDHPDVHIPLDEYLKKWGTKK